MRIATVCIAAALSLAVGNVWAATRDYHFRVLLDGRDIGHHRFAFEPLAEGSDDHQLISEAQYQVKILFVTAYAYQHRSVETWRNGCVEQIDSVTDDNGEDYLVQGGRGEGNRGEGNPATGSFNLEVNGQEQAVDEGCTRTFAYWNPALLESGQLLNSQTGKLEPVTLVDKGHRPLPWSPDRQAKSLELLTEHGPIQLWYGEDGRWLGLRSTLANDRVLQYQPMSAAMGAEQAPATNSLEQRS